MAKEKNYKYKISDRDYFFSKFKDFLNEDCMGTEEELDEHELSTGNKTAVNYFNKTINSLNNDAKMFIDSYAKKDDVKLLQKAMYKISAIIEEAEKYKDHIQEIIQDHNS